MDSKPGLQQWDFSLSIVSHGQASLVEKLLADLVRLKPVGIREIILTINVPEDERDFGEGIEIVNCVIRNKTPKGFGANHNTAFERSSGKGFIVVNPDVRLTNLDLAEFASVLEDPGVGACAPLVVNSEGIIEDSYRRYPTLPSLSRRVVFRDRRPDYSIPSEPTVVDWVAGMFIVFSAVAFRKVNGFDSGYFMYMEDADICRRLEKENLIVLVQPGVTVIHDAQRSSFKNFQHFLWHLRSTIRFLFSI